MIIVRDLSISFGFNDDPSIIDSFDVVVTQDTIDNGKVASATFDKNIVDGIQTCKLEKLTLDTTKPLKVYVRSNYGVEHSAWANFIDDDINDFVSNGEVSVTSKIFYQSTMPDGQKGDLWFDTDDNNKLYTHNGTTFVVGTSLATSALLSNESHTVPSNTDGSSPLFTGCTTTMSVFTGTTDDSANWTYSVAKTNVTCSEAATSRTQTVTAMSADVGYIDITASKSGYASITKRFTITKAKQGLVGSQGAPGATGATGATGANGTDALTVILSNEAHTIPCNSSGTPTSYTGSGTTISLFEGTTQLTYDGVGTSNSTWKITAVGSGITVGTITDSGAYATVGVHSAMTTDPATITYTITGKRANGTAISLTKQQTLTKSITGATGSKGDDGYIANWEISSGMVVEAGGQKIRSTVDDNTWNKQAYTTNYFTGSAYLSFRVGQIDKHIIFGLTTSTDADDSTSYTTIDYAFYPKPSGNLEIYENGTSKGSFGTYTTNSKFEIVYSGTTLTYLVDGVVKRSVTVPAGMSLSIDSSFYEDGYIDSIYFGSVFSADILRGGSLQSQNFNNIDRGTNFDLNNGTLKVFGTDVFTYLGVDRDGNPTGGLNLYSPNMGLGSDEVISISAGLTAGVSPLEIKRKSLSDNGSFCAKIYGEGTALGTGVVIGYAENGYGIPYTQGCCLSISDMRANGGIGISIVAAKAIVTEGDGYFKSLYLTGALTSSSYFKSTIVTGTAPYQCASTTLNTNLNADYLDGYHGSSSATENTYALRNSSGDILCRLLRSNYENQTTISGALAFRVNNSTDNYVRFCSNTTAIKTWLGISGGIGEGQTWQNVTASRVSGTTYTNSTGKPIMVFFSNNYAADYYINGVLFGRSVATGETSVTSFIVPNGATYKITGTFGAGYQLWYELR